MNGGLRVDGLTERYGNKLAVDGLSFGLAPGEILALAGPNGAGKTTTLLCVAGLLRPEAGLFFWQDRPLGPERTRTMAPIPETPDVYDMLTVWEHLVFVANSCRLSNGWEEHAEALLKRLAIADQRDNLGEALSKRMRQKLLVAAAILASTPVGFVLIGLALIASAFSNLPVQVSGLVNIRLSHPRRAPGSDRVRSHRLCFVAARPGKAVRSCASRYGSQGLTEAKARTLITPRNRG